MSNYSYMLVLFFGVVLSARFTMAMNSFELQTLMNNIDYIKDKLQVVLNSLQENEHHLHVKLTKHENNINEKFDSLEKSVKTSEENTRIKLEEMQNHMIPKIDRMHETSQNELKKLRKNKEILDMLTNSVHNLTTNAEVRNSLKETQNRLQEKLTKHENNISEKIETIEAKMHAIEDSLKKSVEASEKNTRTKLEELKNHMILNMNRIQASSQTELIKLGENKEILDILTNLMHNLTTNVETRSKTLEDHSITPVRSCRQVTDESGTYLFRLEKSSKPFEVFCEQHKFDGGWIVIQHRYDGSVDFYRNWTEYRNGFGTLDGEFWLGLEYVHQITKHRPHELLVEVKDFHGNYGYAKYGEFEIGDESELYVLKKLGAYSGTAGDAMKYHKNQKFTTFDRDNDDLKDGNCAERFHGAWWYESCLDSNINGRYQNTTGDGSAMVWRHFKNDWRGLSYSRMMIRDTNN